MLENPTQFYHIHEKEALHNTSKFADDPKSE